VKRNSIEVLMASPEKVVEVAQKMAYARLSKKYGLSDKRQIEDLEQVVGDALALWFSNLRAQSDRFGVPVEKLLPRYTKETLREEIQFASDEAYKEWDKEQHRNREDLQFAPDEEEGGSWLIDQASGGEMPIGRDLRDPSEILAEKRPDLYLIWGLSSGNVPLPGREARGKQKLSVREISRVVYLPPGDVQEMIEQAEEFLKRNLAEQLRKTDDE
jgi:hypothetical protein